MERKISFSGFPIRVLPRGRLLGRSLSDGLIDGISDADARLSHAVYDDPSWGVDPLGDPRSNKFDLARKTEVNAANDLSDPSMNITSSETSD